MAKKNVELLISARDQASQPIGQVGHSLDQLNQKMKLNGTMMRTVMSADQLRESFRMITDDIGRLAQSMLGLDNATTKYVATMGDVIAYASTGNVFAAMGKASEALITNLVQLNEELENIAKRQRELGMEGQNKWDLMFNFSTKTGGHTQADKDAAAAKIADRAAKEKAAEEKKRAEGLKKLNEELRQRGELEHKLATMGMTAGQKRIADSQRELDLFKGPVDQRAIMQEIHKKIVAEEAAKEAARKAEEERRALAEYERDATDITPQANQSRMNQGPQNAEVLRFLSGVGTITPATQTANNTAQLVAIMKQTNVEIKKLQKSNSSPETLEPARLT